MQVAKIFRRRKYVMDMAFMVFFLELTTMSSLFFNIWSATLKFVMITHSAYNTHEHLGNEVIYAK